MFNSKQERNIDIYKVLDDLNTNSHGLRLCKVGDRLGYFHTWEQISSVLEPSMLLGGHPGGAVAQMYAIVEFSDGVKRVQPYDVRFIDKQNDILKNLNDDLNELDAIEKLSESLIETWQKFFPPNQEITERMKNDVDKVKHCFDI